MKQKIYIAKKHRKNSNIEFLKYLLEQEIFPTTYKDVECKKLHCNKGKSRSIFEITRLVQTYFPNTTETLIFGMIYNYIFIFKNKRILYCNDICRLTLFKKFGNTITPKKLGVIHDYQGYMKSKYWELKDHITITYFLRKVGFTKKQIQKELSIK